jgi:two-component system, NarL family, response regulator DevR
MSGGAAHSAIGAKGGAIAVMSASHDAALAAYRTPIRILIVDDHMLVRQGLASLIEPQPDMRVVGQAGSVREAIALAQSTAPDVILMDFTLPDGTGEEATRAILAVHPGAKVVFLTVHGDDDRLFAALAAGAMGYLLKSVRAADLLRKLREVAQDELVFSPGIGQHILEVVRKGSAFQTGSDIAALVPHSAPLLGRSGVARAPYYSGLSQAHS